MATAPIQTELSVNYSAGTKVNIGNYESIDAHVSRSERYNVEGLSPEAIDQFYAERYEALQKEVGALVVSKRHQIMDGDL